MINILQLCAGRGSRFADTHKEPKPFIDVKGRPMFMAALESLNLKKNQARVHHLFQQLHIDEYNPAQYTDGIIHAIDYYTDGAATSAAYVIDKSEYKSEPWLIVDCDFIITHDTDKFLDIAVNYNMIFVERSSWDIGSSYSVVDEIGFVHGVAEKQPISVYRNTGQYLWASGELFMDAYNFYKERELLSSGEFYVAPLYNYAIQKGYPTRAHYMFKYTAIGTPTDLEKYLNGPV